MRGRTEASWWSNVGVLRCPADAKPATRQWAKGKDLYDAVLLAELPGTKLSRNFLRKVMTREFGASGHGIAFNGLHNWRIDWAGFVAEYSEVLGMANDWLARLDALLLSVLENPVAIVSTDWDDHVMTTYAGDFEVHLTVVVEDSAMDRLAAWAAGRGVKFAHVVLERGVTASQPMLTLRGSGALENALREADVVVGGLGDAGFAVARVKVEYAPYAEGVPRTGGEAERLPGDVYFEHHIKLLLAVGTDADDDASALLADLATPHGAHVSRNARRIRDDGRVERFVTQRCRGVGDGAAIQRLRSLTDDVVRADYEILSAEREFVVYDSAPAVDAGWITEEGGLS